MLTNCVLVGTVKETPVVETSSKGNTYAHLVMECEKPYAGADGVIARDQFHITLWRGMAEECAAACRVGSVIAIKGRLEAHAYEKDERTIWITDIIAEKFRLITR